MALSTPAPALPRWDLDGIYPGAESLAFANDLEAVMSGIDRLVALYDQHEIAADGPELDPDDAATRADAVIEASNHFHGQLRPLAAYLHARLTTDTADEVAAARNSRLQVRLAELGALASRWEGWVARHEPESLAARSPVAAEHRFALDRAAAAASHRMSDGEEALAAALRPSGSLSWSKLHRDLTSAIVVELDRGDGPERLAMSTTRGLATHADTGVRAAGHAAELAAWEQHEVPLAATLNGAIGERVVLNRRRRWDDDLDAALFANNVDRGTVEAMHAAVDRSLPAFRRYLRAKAEVLDPGAAPGLAWSDLFAPVADGSTAIPWPDALDRVRDAFSRYDPSLVALLDRAVADRWIDAEPRSGKVDGAFCLPVRPGESRVLLNYDGSAKSVSTLAHELGHAFHGTQLAERTPWQRTTPMALAETASIFCETLLVESLLTDAGTDADLRLALLDVDLQGATQVVVDIRSRFLFEHELCRRRAERALAPSELCGAMGDAQAAAYGNGLRSGSSHRYMWAVKSHYFTPFYNWPYTFGLLFGLGLFARFVADPDRFRQGYHDLLSRTGMDDAATLADAFAIDVRSEEFWAGSLGVLERRIDDFVELAATGAGTASR